MELFAALLGLLDDTIVAMFQVPIFALLLGGLAALAAFGLVLQLKDAAYRNRQ